MKAFGAGARKQEARGERAAASALIRDIHRRYCERGRGYITQRSTGFSYPAPCRDWRRCAHCARTYGQALSKRWSKVHDLTAFVVLTMPPGLRERWRDKAAIGEMMKAWRRLYERLCRHFGRRPKLMHFKEHAGESGGLHMNILWDWPYIEQSELSRLAEECGFGPICHISAIGQRARELIRGRVGSAPAISYAAKEGFRVRAYARKTGGQTGASGDDWPRSTRRWSASRAAAREMGAREPNPDWYWTEVKPLSDDERARLWAESPHHIWLLPDRYLPDRTAATAEPPRSPPDA